MHQLDDCIFCQIIRGDAPCHLIHEDELTMTFLDIFPASKGHMLIITKEHFCDIFEAKPEALAQVAANSVVMAAAINKVLAPDGLGVYQLNRAAAGQTVFHYHTHLIPQTEGSAVGIHSKHPADSEQLITLAQQLRQAVAASDK